MRCPFVIHKKLLSFETWGCCHLHLECVNGKRAFFEHVVKDLKLKLH
jgi:hypothetical protein